MASGTAVEIAGEIMIIFGLIIFWCGSKPGGNAEQLMERGVGAMLGLVLAGLGCFVLLIRFIIWHISELSR